MSRQLMFVEDKDNPSCGWTVFRDDDGTITPVDYIRKETWESWSTSATHRASASDGTGGNDE